MKKKFKKNVLKIEKEEYIREEIEWKLIDFYEKKK